MAANSSPDLDELARGALDGMDGRALREMAALYDRVDPVPDGLVARLQFAVTLDALHAEIARLQRVASVPASARGEDAEATEVQTVTFTSETVTTMVTITAAGPDRVRIDGWAAPGGGLRVQLRVTGDTLDTTADSDGRFVFDDVPRGLAQFVLRPASPGSSTSVITPSIEL